MARLAIYRGTPVRTRPFPAYRVLGSEEKAAAERVIESGILSRFLGTWHEDFYGGPEVRALESEWAARFQVKHAIAVNSATSGLFCAVGAARFGPGDEVIVSPYTMSASAVAPLVFNAIPVFADIEPDFYCLSAESIRKRLTPRTKGIIAVDLFGQPIDAPALRELAREKGLILIEDCAQAPGARHGTRWAGTLGDIGVYSLNYHKHIHSGEGGLVVTDDDELAERVRLIRNHAESVVGGKGLVDIVNMLGFNFRMTELEAAVAREQLKKLDGLLDKRLANIRRLEEGLSRIPCLAPAGVRPGCRHAFYLHTLRFDAEKAGASRDQFVAAVKAELPVTELRETEGVKVGAGYVKPLYLLPMFQKRIAYGGAGCPWTCDKYGGSPEYGPGTCPVAEDLHFRTLITHELMRPPMSGADLDDVVAAFQKVWDCRAELQ